MTKWTSDLLLPIPKARVTQVVLILFFFTQLLLNEGTLSGIHGTVIKMLLCVHIPLTFQQLLHSPVLKDNK